MRWFGRKKVPGTRIPLASNEPVERWKQRVDASGLTLVNVKKVGRNTYQTFSGDDPEAAKAFLRNEPVDKELYYIVVETPDGAWGTDIDGLYLENLRPWQLRIDEAECDGTISGLIDGFHSLELAARGIADSVVLEVACGRCSREWIDGVRYRDVTLVRCPGCSAANRIHSSRLSVSFYG